MSYRLPQLVSALALLAACGGEGSSGEPVAGVLHLDPRLADGRSPAAALDSGEELVRTFTVTSVETAAQELEPWELVNSLILPPERGAGVRLRARDYRPAEGVTHAALRFPEPLDASLVNRIEVDLAGIRAGHAAITWRSGKGAPRRRAEAMTVGGGPETIAFNLSAHPEWSGAVEELRLTPCWRGPQSYELRAIRFLRDPFSPGHSPGREAGDGGLLGFGPDLRRTWPSDEGLALHDRVQVPRGGRVVVDVAAPGAEGGASPLCFALDVRPEEDAPWEERARWTRPDVGAGGWHPLSADLSDLAGREVELRFRAERRGTGAAADRRPARIWWGSPMLLGELHADRRPNVLLVTLDTLRSDAVGCYGGTPVTPFLDGLAAEGMLFEDAWCACNSTLPSHVSILTGLAVPTHGVRDNRSTLAEEVRTLAQSLRAAGYHTAAAVSVEHLQAGWSGLGRGFDRYQDVRPGAPLDGAATLEGVLRWIEEWRAQGEVPFFLWVHLFDPHTPYGPPRPFLVEFAREWEAAGREVPATMVEPSTIGETPYTEAGKFLEGVSNVEYARFLYEASVAYTDTLLCDLVQGLCDAGYWEDTLAAITADHGESLGERDVWFNHQLLHTPVMHVPLVLRIPGGEPERVSQRVWNADVARTLVDQLGLTGIDPMGRDLLGGAQADGSPERRIWFVHAGLDQAGCRDEDVHYWHNLREYRQLGPQRVQPAGAHFLYEHPADPELADNLAASQEQRAGAYQAALEQWLAENASGRRVRAQLSSEQDARLDDMGYAGGDDEEQ